jgi:putative DNA primase/helicase
MVDGRHISEAELAALKARHPCDAVAGQWVRLRKQGRKMIGPCPVCSANRQSGSATRFECDADGWVCAVCQDGGDVIKLVQLVQFNSGDADTFLAAVDWLGGARGPEDPAAAAERERRRREIEAKSAEFREQERGKVFEIWKRGTAIAGTPVEAYLCKRLGIDAADCTIPDRDALRLRALEAMPYYATGARDAEMLARASAMLAPIVRGGKFCGLHVTYLDLAEPKGKLFLRGPDGEALPAKKVRGSKAGGHIEIVGRTLPGRLIIGEGIEKTLAVFAALCACERADVATAFWTSVDLGNLGGKAAAAVAHPTLKNAAGRAQRVPGPDPDLSAPGIEIPDSVTEIIILGDASSDPFTTQCAIARAAARWARPGRLIEVAWSSQDEDFDDALRAGPWDEACARIVAVVDQAKAIERPELAAPRESTSRKGKARVRDDGGQFQSAPPTAMPAADGRPPWPPDADEKLEDALAACAEFDESDTDNGKRLIRYFGRDLLVMAQSGVPVGAFLHWSGAHWDLDGGTAGAHVVAQKIGDFIWHEADFLGSTAHEREAISLAEAAMDELNALDAKDKSDATQTRRKRLKAVIAGGSAAHGALAIRRANRRAFAISSKNMARIKNMLEAAGPHLRRSPDAFNTDPLLLATRTHTLRFVREVDPECPDPDVVRFRARVVADAAHRRADMLTAMVPVEYRPDAAGEKWRKFLDRCLPQREKRRTVQAFSGLGLTGLPIQRVMFHHGAGANGKSVYLEVLTRLLGESFAVGLPVESITGMGGGTGAQASPDIARLFGKRVLRVHELPAGGLLKADVIKKLTGGERLIARDLFKGFFEFQPCAKPHMSGNDFPNFDGSDGGMRRRLIVMHWTEVIPESEQRDFEEFVADLLTEAPAILNWLIDGALDYLANGLVVGEEDREYTEGYFNEMDPVGQFVRACVRELADHHEKARDVYNAYVAWSMANSKRPMSEARFGRIAKKTMKRDDSGRVHVYRNVELHDVPERPNEGGAVHAHAHASAAAGDDLSF